MRAVNNRWRLIIDGVNCGAWNMAYDESLLSNCLKRSGGTLRFYKWQPACLSLGYFQDIEEIDLETCKKRGIDVIRRPTGGRGVLHNNELTYSITLPLQLLEGTLVDTYKLFSQAIVRGLNQINIPARLIPSRPESSSGSAACFDSPAAYELTVNNKKLIGSAQTRRKDCLLQHGSIPIFPSNDILVNLLKMDDHKREKLKRILNSKATCLIESGLNNQGVEQDNYLKFIAPVERAITRGFTEIFAADFIEEGFTKEEENLARELYQKKYSTPNWNFKRRH